MKVGSFGQAQEPNRNAIHRKDGKTSLGLLRPEWMATAMPGKFVPWQGCVLTEADVPNPRRLDQDPI